MASAVGNPQQLIYCTVILTFMFKCWHSCDLFLFDFERAFDKIMLQTGMELTDAI